MARPIENSRGRASPTPALLGFALLVAILYFGREFLIPIALAILLTFLLAPLSRRLERWRIPRAIAVALVVGTLALGVGGVGWLVERQVIEVATNVAEYKSEILAKLDSLWPRERHALHKAGTALAEIGREISKPVPGDGDDPLPPARTPIAAARSTDPTPVRIVEAPIPPLAAAGSVLGPMLGRLATVLVVLVFTVFMLFNREDLRNRFIRLVAPRDLHVITPALDDAGTRISRYLLMQCAMNAGVGLVVGLMLLGLGVPSAAFWGLLAGLLRFVPYVGTWIAALLPASVVFATGTGLREPLLIIALIGAVELVAGQIIEPLVFRNGTGLSPVAILAATIFWAWLWGPVGLVLAMPLTSCLVVIGRHVPRLRYLEILLGDEPVLAPGARVYQRLLAGDPEEAHKVTAAAAKDRSLAEVYDHVLIPALRFSESDRDRGELEEEREQSVREMLAAIAEDLDARPAPRSQTSGAAPGTAPPQVLCVPVRDPADELAARMLERTLATRGIAARTLSADALISEIVDDATARRPLAICISAVPPQAALHARVLCRRLRARLPGVPILVGLWDAELDEHAARSRLGDLAADDVVTSLAGAADRFEAIVRNGAAVNGVAR